MTDGHAALMQTLGPPAAETPAVAGARADFECRKCEATYDDLPANSTRCPVCGFKRGFRRLFNRVNVSTKGHRVAVVLDPMMRGQLEEMDRIKNSAQESERKIREDVDRQVETTPENIRPAVRAAQAAHGGPVRWWGGGQAKAALGSVSPEWRHSSNQNLPHLKRRVIKLPA